MASYLLRRNDARVCSCWSCSLGLTWHSWSGGRRGIQIRSTCWRVVSSQTLVPSRLLLVAAVLGGCIVVGQSVCMYADAVVHATLCPTLVTASTRPARAGWLHFFFFFCQRPDCDAFAGSTAG